MIDERKKKAQTTPPAPTASAVGLCPTLIQISRTPRHWKFTQHHRTTPSLLRIRENTERLDARRLELWMRSLKSPGEHYCENWTIEYVTFLDKSISYPQCSLTFMRERYLHRSFAYAKSAVGIDVVSVHKLFAYRVVSTVSTDIVSSHTKNTVESHTVSQNSRMQCKVKMNEWPLI